MSATTPTAPPSSAFRPSYANLLGCLMLEDNLRMLSDFLYAHAMTPDLEIEGKLGLVFKKSTSSSLGSARIHLDGVRGLVALAADEIDAQFAAEVDFHMWKHIKEQLLQRRVAEEHARVKVQGGRPTWTMEHKQTIDKFHMVGNDSVRVTYNLDRQVLECIVKDKLQHLDFWSDNQMKAAVNGKPKCIDFRVSANRERKVSIPTTECYQIRRKDRYSFRYDLFAIELTKVELFNSLVKGEISGPDHRPNITTFEVEVELKEVGFLRQEAEKVKTGAPNEFIRVAQSLLETLRTLAQYALPNQLPPGWKPVATQPTAASTTSQNSSTATSAAAAAAQSKKRPREEETATKKDDDYGKAWS